MTPRKRSTNEEDDAGPSKRPDLGVRKIASGNGSPRSPKLVATPYVTSKRLGTQISHYRQEEWLERSKQWPDMKTGDWVPKAVLGGGTYGLVGLWRYAGKDPKFPKHMAVKQSHFKHRRSLEWESKVLRQLMGTGTKHVVKLYKGFHADGGSGTTPGVDPLPFGKNQNYKESLRVCRIYMEYCEKGDLKVLEDYWGKRQYPPSEEWVWRTFLCFMKAHLLLDQGNENPNEPNIMNQKKAWGRPIAHFDLKAANVLIGEKDGSDHRLMEGLKLADFGQALKCPRDDEAFPGEPGELRSAKWIEHTRWRFSSGHAAPEQFYEDHDNRVIDSRTGIYISALILHKIISGYFPSTKFHFMHRSLHFPLDDTKDVFVQADPGLLMDQDAFPYSERLIDFFCSCLAFYPAHRPPIAELVREAQRWVDAYDAEFGDIEPTVDMLREGDISTGGLPLGAKMQHFKTPPMDVNNTYEYELQNPPQPPLARSPEDKSVALLFNEEHVGFGPMKMADYPYSLVDKTPNRNEKTNAASNSGTGLEAASANPVLGTKVPLTAQQISPTQLNTTSTIPNTKGGDDEDEAEDEDEAGYEDEDGDEDSAQPQNKPAQAAKVEDIRAESGSEYAPSLPS